MALLIERDDLEDAAAVAVECGAPDGAAWAMYGLGRYAVAARAIDGAPPDAVSPWLGFVVMLGAGRYRDAAEQADRLDVALFQVVAGEDGREMHRVAGCLAAYARVLAGDRSALRDVNPPDPDFSPGTGYDPLCEELHAGVIRAEDRVAGFAPAGEEPPGYTHADLVDIVDRQVRADRETWLADRELGGGVQRVALLLLGRCPCVRALGAGAFALIAVAIVGGLSGTDRAVEERREGVSIGIEARRLPADAPGGVHDGHDPLARSASCRSRAASRERR